MCHAAIMLRGAQLRKIAVPGSFADCGYTNAFFRRGLIGMAFSRQKILERVGKDGEDRTGVLMLARAEHD